MMRNTIKVTIADPNNAPKNGILKVSPSSKISPTKRKAYPIPTSVLIPKPDIPNEATKKCNASSAMLMISSPCPISSPPSAIISPIFSSQIHYLKHMDANTRNAISALSQLAQSQLQQANHLNYYAERIEAHAQAIEKLNKVLDKLDRLLSQRRLGEFEG